MGNLGRYQDIVEAAKAVGGVENLIENIEVGAVAKAAPALVGKGAALGAAGLAAAVALGTLAKRAWVDRVAREALAEDSKQELRSAVIGDTETRASIAFTADTKTDDVPSGDDETPSAAEE